MSELGPGAGCSSVSLFFGRFSHDIGWPTPLWIPGFNRDPQLITGVDVSTVDLVFLRSGGLACLVEVEEPNKTAGRFISDIESSTSSFTKLGSSLRHHPDILSSVDFYGAVRHAHGRLRPRLSRCWCRGRQGRRRGTARTSWRISSARSPSSSRSCWAAPELQVVRPLSSGALDSQPGRSLSSSASSSSSSRPSQRRP